MSVDVGSAVGYLDLDIKGFLDSLKSAQEAAAEGVQNIQKTAGRTWESMADSMTSWGKSLSLSVTAPLTAAAGVALKFGVDFETAMNNVAAITQMTEEELSTLEEGIHNISRATGLTSADLANNAKMVAEAGGDLDLVMAQLQHGANLAVATQTDLATTLDMVGSTMKTFGLEAENTQAVVDSLASVTTMANTTLSDLSQAYVNVGGTAAQVGMSLDEVNAFLTEFANQGLKGGAAGTALNGVLRNLTAPTEKASAMFDQLGISLYDQQGASRDIMDVMGELEKKLSTMSDEQRKYAESVIFDTVSLKAWNNITATGVDSIRELAEELENSGEAFDGLGQAAGMTAKQNEGLGASMKGLWNEIQRLGIEFTKIVDGPMKSAIGVLTGLIEWFGKLPDSVQATIIVLGAVAAAIGPLLLIGGQLITSIITISTAYAALAPGIIAATTATWAWTVALLANPITWIVGLIVGLIAVIVLLYRNWDEVSAFFSETWEGIKIIGGECIEWLGNKLSEFGTWCYKTWTDCWTNVGEFFSETWEGIKILTSEACTWIGEKLSAFGTWVYETWTKCWTKVCAFFSETWESIKSIASSVWEWISSKFTTVVDKVSEVVSKVVEIIRSIPSKMLEIGKNIVDGLWNGIVNAWNGLINNMYKLMQQLPLSVQKFLGIASPSKVFADSIGQWIPKGIALGFEEAMPLAIKNMQSALDTGMGMLNAGDVNFDYGLAPAKAKNASDGQYADDSFAGQQNTGGNTYIFNSPVPIDAAQARREFEQVRRNMAFGF